MTTGLDETFPPPEEVWAEMARALIAGDHRLGQAVRFMEDGGTNPTILAEQVTIKPDYASFLLTHAKKMKSGTIRVVVSETNDGHETANNQAHHYRYLLAENLTPETRRYVVAVIEKFRTVNPKISLTPANAQGANDSFEVEVESERPLCTNTDCEWAWTHHGGDCS